MDRPSEGAARIVRKCTLKCCSGYQGGQRNGSLVGQAHIRQNDTFVYLGPAAWVAYRKGQPKTGKGFLLLGGFGVLMNAIWLAAVFR